MNHGASWSLISVLGRAAGPLWCVHIGSQRQGSMVAVEVRQMVFALSSAFGDYGVLSDMPFFLLSQAAFTQGPSEPDQDAPSLLISFHVCDVRSHIAGYGAAG